MDSPQSIEDSEARVRETFRRRQRVAGIAAVVFSMLLGSGVALRRSLVPAAQELLLVLVAGLCIATLVLCVRAFRCIACGGGIRLDGRTCSACGKQY